MTAEETPPPDGVPEEFCTPMLHGVGEGIEVIPARLSLAIHEDDKQTMDCITADKETFYFSSWQHESYDSFCSDFGPVNLSMVVSFCEHVTRQMADSRLQHRHLVHYCSRDVRHCTNLAFLLGSYVVLVERWTPEEAAKRFDSLPSVFVPFRDASFGPSTFDLNLLDCFRALRRAEAAGYFSLASFNAERYHTMDDPQSFDAHTICPKFVAMAGPRRRSVWEQSDKMDGEGVCGSRWEQGPAYAQLMHELGVGAVVRLEAAGSCGRGEWEAHGIAHYDLLVDDPAAPAPRLLHAFHLLADRSPGPLAVHCLTGLGRTPTLIATWLMRRAGFSAREAMAWLRIVRPGSVLGPQQHFLEQYEQVLRLASDSAQNEGADMEAGAEAGQGGDDPDWCSKTAGPEVCRDGRHPMLLAVERRLGDSEN